MLNSKLFYLGYIIIGVILLFRLLRWCLIQYIYRKFAIKLVIKGCRLFRLKYLSIGYGQQAAILENICFHFNFGRDTSKKWFSIVVDKLEFNLIKNIKIQQDEAPSNQEKETNEQNSNKAKPSKVVTEKRRQLLSRLIVLLTSKCLDIDIKQLTLKIYREASPSLYAEVVVLDGIKIFASVADRRRTSILNMHLSSKRQVTKLYSMQGLQWSPNFKVDDIAKPMAEMSVHIDVDLIIEPMAGIGSAELRIKLDKIEIVVAEESLSLLTPISTPRSSSQTATNREVNNESDPSSPLQNLYSKLPKSIDLSICQSNATLSTKSSKRCLQVALDVFSARLSKDKWEKNLSLPVFSASLSLNGLQVQENMSNEICVLQRLTTFARTEICDDKLKLAVGGDISTIFFKYSASSIQYWHHLLPRREVKEIENSSQSDRIEIKTARSTALERIVQELLITVNITLADITFEFDFRTDTSKPFHCTRIVMGSLNTVAEVPEANRLKIDFGMENLLVETNKNSEILYGRLRKNNTFVLPQSRKHVWGRVISFANLQAQAFAHMHSGKLHSITINSQATAPCIEFSEAVEDFITMAKIYIPKSKSANNTRIKSDPNNRTNEKIIAEMNIKITDVNLFLCHYNKDINPIMLRIDDALFLNNSSEPLTFNISGIKCATISKKDKENNTFKREMANAIKMGFLDCPSVRVTKDLDNINIVLTEFIVDWDPTTHRCIADNITYAVSTIKQIKEYRQGSTKESTSTKNDVQTNTSTAISKKFVTLDLIAVNMKLSERTTTTWKATALKSIIVNTDNFTISSKTLCWNLDGNDIFSFETVCMTSTHEDQEMQSLRQTLPNLTNPTNKSWCWSVVNANAFFPFAYNFGVAFSDFTGIIKMLRILHKPSKKPGAIEKLPWDLLIKFENANFSCEDDPFEVKLGENYALLLDEADQCTQREELLEARLDKIRKTKGEFIPVKKIEELYRSLHEKNVQIYLQRSKKLHGSPLRRNLFSWKGEDLRIFAFADPSMHGKENIVSCMRRLDPNSPYPDSDPDYSTLWCRLIHIESKILNMPVRDYPQSIINIKGFKVDGMLAGAEVIPPDRATYTSTIHIGQPWNDMEITRRMPPQKYYYNLKIDVEHLEIAYGPCFSPALAQVGLALDLLSKTSRDPSPRLTWWDKMRLLFHGRVSIFASALHYFWHASFDPYDKSERMEIRGKNADLDWFNGHINLMGKLRLLLRTASKYDDCCLLNVPHMEAGIDLIWNCHGDCKDHHSVLPCAPDKIPAHQSDKAYDSYAAFRSRALKIKLALKFMEKAANDTVGKAMSSIPECYLYASSLRWLEHFKLVVLHHITRPVRRGKLYNNVRVRKPGFVQHIDVLDLDVSFPKLMLTYSGSFARKVGFRATSARGHLSIMFQHALIPYQDGLIRRPNSIWTTSESGYDINDVTIMLCANLDSDTEYLSPDFVDFDKEEHLLSLKSLTYRYNNKAIPPSKDDTNPYTHTIKINDLKASWTTFNRDTALSIFWANKKSQTLKHDLSSDFIKQIKHSTAKPVVITENVPEPESQRSFSANESKPFGNMLQDLLSDQSNFVVTCEDEKSDNTAQTTKNILPDEEDVHQRHILIEAVNSQVILKGTETNGCLVTSAANTRLYRLIHTPRWRSHKLLLKTSWSALFDNIQYFGTVGGSYYKTDDIPWLKPSLIQSRGTDSMDSIVSEGVGHVVHDVEKRRGAPRKSISFLRSTSLLDNDEDDLEITISDGDNLDAVTEEDEDQDQTKIAVPEIVQLQRIISRCSAQFSYISYMDEASNVLMESPTYTISNQSELEPAVDSIKIYHTSLEISTNSAQYAMLIDIVENFVLYVEPKKKEESELIEKMKFKLQLNEDEDIGTPLLQLQNTVRYQLRTMRKLERAMFLARQQLILHEEEKASRLTDQIKELEDEIIEVKENVDMACDELRLMITSLKESKLYSGISSLSHTNVSEVKRVEVLFGSAGWSLVQINGNHNVASAELKNFCYTKRNMSNDCVEHKLEIGDFAVHNLLQVPNNSFKDALCPQKLKTKVQIDRDVAVRIFCREMPRVGGISVKEHFEVNVVPLAVRLTNHLYKNFMKFFFPHRFENSDASHDDETASRLGSDSDSDDDTMSIISESGESSHFNFPSSPAASHKEFRYSRSQDTSSIKRCDSIDSVRSRASVSEGSHRRISFTHNSESNQDQKAERSKKLLRRMLDDEDVLNKMKERASKNQTFIYIKIPQVPLLVSYKGQKDKNLADVNDFNLALPTLEYHNVTWQWIDLLLAMKKDCRQALLSQAIKEKLRFRHTSDGESNPKDIDASKTSDQDKYRLLLGVQDKPSKKKLSLKLFGKKNAKEKDLKSPHSPLPTRANIPDSSIAENTTTSKRESPISNEYQAKSNNRLGKEDYILQSNSTDV